MSASTAFAQTAQVASGDRFGEGASPLRDRARFAERARPDMIFLSGGHFLMGSNSFYREERPVRPAFVDGFWIDKYPVTNAEFGRFVEATGYVTYSERQPTREMYPDAD